MELIKKSARPEKCANCKFFDRQTDLREITKVQGHCVRFPPSAFPLPAPGGQIAAVNLVPTVSGDGYCGEWSVV